MNLITIEGVVCPGYGIASKGSTKSQELDSNKYPGRKVIVDQTVYRQFPFFVDAGVVGIADMHPGTINVDISPKQFGVMSPDYTITCEWIEGVEETFWLTALTVLFNEKEYDGYLYFPCISDQHAPRNSMMEIITCKIDGIEYGKNISIEIDPLKIEVQS